MLPTRNKDICKTAEDVGHQLGYTQIKAEQKHAIVSFVQGNDVFVVLPATGFGKSLCYACLPLIFDRLSGKSGSIALIISPLVALMQDQVKGFSTIGIKCARVGSCTEEQVRQEIIDGEYQLVFISPEALLATRRWRKMLLSPVYQKSLIAVVVDEAHCVRNWSVKCSYCYTCTKIQVFIYLYLKVDN